MLKYFANPLWAIHTTRGVQDVLKSEMDPRSPQKAPWHLACCMQAEVRSGGTRSCHSMSNVCRLFTCFPAVMGHEFLLVWRSSWPSVSYKSCLFRVPVMFSAGGLFVLENQKMSEHASNTHKPREPGTVRNRSWPFLAHGMPQLYMYIMLQNCVS